MSGRRVEVVSPTPSPAARKSILSEAWPSGNYNDRIVSYESFARKADDTTTGQNTAMKIILVWQCQSKRNLEPRKTKKFLAIEQVTCWNTHPNFEIFSTIKIINLTQIASQ